MQTRTSPKWLHYLNLVWNGFASLAFGLLAVLTLRSVLKDGLNPYLGQVSNRAFYLWIYTSGFFALLALVGFIDSLRRITGKKKSNRPNSSRWLKFSIIFFPISLYLIWAWESSTSLLDWIFAILVFVGVLVPVVWITRIASSKLWGAHPGRSASLMSLTVSISTPFIMVVQGLVMAGFFMLLYITDTNVFTTAELSLDFEALLQSSMLMFLLFCFLVLVVPVIEELFKTLVVWPLLGMNISPREGYQAGLMSGAAFALFEGALYAIQTASVAGNDWIFFLLGRLGGTLIHIFNGGLIGWALATAWFKKEHLKAVLAYLIAMIIHGLWNLIVFATQFVPISQGVETNEAQTIVAMTIMFSLVSVCFVFFAKHVNKPGEAKSYV